MVRSLTMKFAIFLIFVCVTTCYSEDWSYRGETGPEHWHEMYPMCGGEQQSPINIIKTETEEMEMLNLTWTGFGDIPPDGASMTLVNLGTTVEVHLTGDYLISGGGLPTTYKATKIHFHWALNMVNGSEHAVGGGKHPMEMHVVGYDYQQYEDFDSALSQPGGIIVIATSIEVGGQDNSAFTELLTGFDSVIYEGQTYHYPSPFPILSMLPYNTWDFYRYHGSLTTPACNEGVLWTVFVEFQVISESQFSNFNILKSNPEGEANVPLGNNFRPIQAINSRTVYRRVDGELMSQQNTATGPDPNTELMSQQNTATGPDPNTCMVIIAIAFVTIMRSYQK